MHKLIDWPWWTLFLPVCLSVLLTSYVPLWHDLWCKHYLAASRPGGGSNAPAGSSSCPCSQGHSPHTRPVRQGQITPHTDPHHTEFSPPECRVSAEGITGAWRSDVCGKNIENRYKHKTKWRLQMLYKIESCSLEKNSTLRPCFMQFIESKLHFHLRINNVMTAILKSFFFLKNLN